MGVQWSQITRNNMSTTSVEAADEHLCNGLVLCNTYIPEEVLANVLSFAEPSTLIKCRKVCRFWKSLIDLEVWHLKVVNEHCQNLADVIRLNNSKLSWVDLYWICKKLPFGKNLVQNNCGQEKLKKWAMLSSGGDGWAIEETPVGADPIPESAFCGHTSCFATSYCSCSKKQTIDLCSEGLTGTFMDRIQPKIRVSEWYATRFDCGAIYEMEVSLLDEKRDAIKKFNFRQTIEQWQGRDWKKVEHEFAEYGSGVRYVEFYHGGTDTQSWKGHYGSKMTGARVVVDW